MTEQRADTSTTDRAGAILVFVAAERGHDDVVRYLVEHGGGVGMDQVLSPTAW